MSSAFACAHSDASSMSSPPPANAREQGNPNSVDNKNLPMPAPSNDAVTNSHDTGNPHSVDNKDASGVPPVDKGTHDAELRAAEAGDPDSIDSTLPPATAVLQRLFIFDEASIATGRLAEQNGAAGGQTLGKRIVRERQINEQRVSELAGRQHVSLLEKDITADQKNRAFAARVKDGNEKLAGLSGLPFDRVYSKHAEHAQERDLKEVNRLRTRCVEPAVCTLLDEMVPMLQHAHDDAHALSLTLTQVGLSP